MTNETLYTNAVFRKNTGRPPVWFMRQAGRYHSHYQALKRKHSFMELCKVPELAAETTFGPIRDFDFDAAILFSDLLFPLEVLGMGLEYSPGPKLGWHLKSLADLKKLNPARKSPLELVEGVSYQGRALQLIRQGLPASKSLLGFVGGPLTLFYYAVEGSHQGSLSDAKKGLTDGRYSGFYEILKPLLIENMSLQAKNGADAVAVMDTCAGDVEPALYREVVIPTLREVLIEFRRRHPKTPVVYYSKGTGPWHWQHLEGLPFECLGIDWLHDLASILRNFGHKWSIQGNFDPNLMLLPEQACLREIEKFFAPILKLPRASLQGWICGLGHGVLQWTPERNVRNFLHYQKEVLK
ncbi:MAG: uroporphyrinogen decarboxylase [Bdellovibrionales bacterium]|nr:uroporphyrinogen decarboxylase [Bdellovibrionales bacterium]